MALYRDRIDAGERLSAALPLSPGADAVVLALPRGGVPIGAIIAKTFGIPLDVILVRKIGAPGNPELALGAVTGPGEVVVNEQVCQLFGLSRKEVEHMAAPQIREIERRRTLYLAGRPRIDLRGKTVVVVDDGVATGATARAALQSLRERGAGRVILAVPVGSADTLAQLRAFCDGIVCPEPHLPYGSVGAAYASFPQVSDQEVAAQLLAAASGDGTDQGAGSGPPLH